MEKSNVQVRSDYAGAIQVSPNDVGVVRHHRRRRLLLRLALGIGLPLTAPVVAVAAWAICVPVFHIPDFVIPAPLHVLNALVQDRSMLFHESLPTTEETVMGFALSIATAIPLGLLIALSTVASRVIYPSLVFIQLVPKIAVAPLFLVWFGFGLQSKVLLTVLMTFFPLLMASIVGFAILDARLLYLTRSMGASQWQTLRFLRLPAALPVIFSGLKTSATIAVTAAIVAEFIGSNTGLGYELLQATTNLQMGLIFAILIVMTLLGVLINLVIEIGEYLLTPWKRVK